MRTRQDPSDPGTGSALPHVERRRLRERAREELGAAATILAASCVIGAALALAPPEERRGVRPPQAGRDPRETNPDPAIDPTAPDYRVAGAEDAGTVLARPDAERLGRHACGPTEIPWPGWKAVLWRTFSSMISDRISLAAAGCAFYAVLSLFPALSMLTFLYGLVFDPATVEPQIDGLRDFLPPPAVQLISARVHLLVSQGSTTLGIGLLVSTLVALWSTASGTKSVIYALNVAYDEHETRSFLRFQAISFGMTIIAIVGAILGLAFLVGLPAAITFLHIPGNQQDIITGISLAVMLGFLLVSLALLYRYGPCRRPARWHWITPGSLIATVLWIIASELFSVYVSHIASYNATYGSLGAFVGVMMWFYVSAYVVLLGAELNSELELQTARDSTRGPPKPMGRRGAFVADHVSTD